MSPLSARHHITNPPHIHPHMCTMQIQISSSSSRRQIRTAGAYPHAIIYIHMHRHMAHMADGDTRGADRSIHLSWNYLSWHTRMQCRVSRAYGVRIHGLGLTHMWGHNQETEEEESERERRERGSKLGREERERARPACPSGTDTYCGVTDSYPKMVCTGRRH